MAATNTDRQDHNAFIASLTPEQRRALCTQSDGPALRHMALHLGGVFAIGAWISTGLPGWWALLLPQGLLIVFLFTALHETIHRTAFASDRLNLFFAAILGAAVLLPPRQFRYFHFAHHRFTHDPERDPELARPKPATLGAYLWSLSGIPDWQWRIRTLITNAVRGPQTAYVPPRGRAPVRNEARCYLAIYAGLAGLSIALGSWALVWAWLLPMVLCNPFLRGYLLAEHSHCPHVSNMFENTRSILTTGLVRWLAWNMPYHAEHHAYPAVPFHKLPELHALCAEHLKSTQDGYVAFHAAYARAAATGEASRAFY